MLVFSTVLGLLLTLLAAFFLRGNVGSKDLADKTYEVVDTRQ